MLVAVAIGIPTGALAAVKPDTAIDYGATMVALWGISMPNFWLGMVLILLFSVTLGWLRHRASCRPAKALIRTC